MIFGNSSSTNATGTTDLPSVYFIKHSDKNIRNLDRLAKEIAENSPFSRLETNCGSYYGSMDRCQWIFFSIYSIEPRVIFSPSTSRDLRALRAHEEKKVKEFSLFSIHFGSHPASSSLFRRLRPSSFHGDSFNRSNSLRVDRRDDRRDSRARRRPGVKWYVCPLRGSVL